MGRFARMEQENTEQRENEISRKEDERIQKGLQENGPKLAEAIQTEAKVQHIINVYKDLPVDKRKPFDDFLKELARAEKDGVATEVYRTSGNSHTKKEVPLGDPIEATKQTIDSHYNHLMRLFPEEMKAAEIISPDDVT